ncbi:MAG: ureidoglycolate lyase [Candidatus Accumulibacter sp.]|jgi:ureidoglycolate lyase|nr:ureidoglycolate lyase [Accumulibacter sp.]
MRLLAEPLSREAFAPFGEVIEAGADRASFPINGGSARRFHGLARLDAGEGGRLTVSIFRARPRRLPFAVTLLERHPKASQAFMPLSGQPFLVVAAPKGETVDPARIRAFLAHGRQGVNFSPGVWHHPLAALARESDFLVIDREDPTDNCDERTLAAPVEVDCSGEALENFRPEKV